MGGVRIQRVEVETILDLRQQVLRPGLPIETACFEGDKDPDTHHLAGYMLVGGRDQLIGCATFMLRSYHEVPAWQLRGMATDDSYRGCGVGKCLLDSAKIQLVGSQFQYKHISLIWCNARESAIGFYERNDWRRESDPFNIEGVGTHVIMTCDL